MWVCMFVLVVWWRERKAGIVGWWYCSFGIYLRDRNVRLRV